MFKGIKDDACSGKCSVYAQWINILALPMLIVAFILALTPFAFSLFNAISCAVAFFLLVALEWPTGWTPMLMKPMMSMIRGPGPRAIGGAVVTAVLVVGTVGVGGISGRALGGAALCAALAALLNLIAVIRKEDSSER